MNAFDLEFPDFSGHPPPPQVDLGAYERWIFDEVHNARRAAMSREECIADFMRNEGSQKEPWPDFGEFPD